MTFWEHFGHILLRRPTEALAALYWHLTGRRVRARNRLRVASADLPFAYDVWRARNEPSALIQHELAARVGSWAWQPQFAIYLHGAVTIEESNSERSVQSLEHQIYPHWRLSPDIVVSGGSTEPSAKAHYVVPLRAGDELSPAALFRFAEALQRNPGAAILYGDEDRLDRRGRRVNPWFKPEWNEEMFLAQDYLSSAVAIRSDVALSAAAQSDNVCTLVLKATSIADDDLVHVPHIITHVAEEEQQISGRAEMVSLHLKSRGATCQSGPFGTVKVDWPLPGKLPLVSMIIPTKDKLDFLRPCVDSLLNRTDYPHFEVLVVDNASVEESTERYLAEIEAHSKVRVLRYAEPFNYSAINNFAAREARGTYLCLLNNDTEVVGDEWLTELMRYAVRPEVGAVGAKLLYDDGSIQHAGVVVGLGDAAGHQHRFLAAGQPGYFRMAHVNQFISAVTGACLLVQKAKFEAVGGLDAEHLAVAYNDVDLCLKLEKAGWRNVYVPHAVLLHHESKSRGNDMASTNIERYRRELQLLQDRWSTKTYKDPLHNPNLDRYSETFVFKI